MRRSAQVEFSRIGWREFARMNRFLGTRYIKAYVMLREVAAYIRAHEEQDIHLDTQCQEIHYDNGIYLLLMRCQGIWYITEIWATDVPIGFTPVYIWQRVKRGWREFIAHALVGWRVTACEPSPGREVAV